MQAVKRTLALAANRNDVILAAFIISVIFMMILPLPTLLIDILIGINITLSSILLMVAIYLPSPLAFSSFPSVLLVSTLFRLGISIATTRLILLDGDAGHIIETFGNFVVGGNLVVGLVVFLILTIVQFIVITKGAERVAEVGARFSLDAMPGKQMSIDADLRAGTIDMDEARRRRRGVEKESQMYGAMDGAMKFVKGDAIAGLIIAVVNLGGGLIIGVMQRGMSLREAATTYSILSIGDGLIAQIPALLTAICAGIIVTRVPNDDQQSSIGKDIGAQVLAHPRALMIAAGLSFGMGLIPGMPTLVFFALAATVGITGFVVAGKARTAAGARQPGASNRAQAGPDGGHDTTADADADAAPFSPAQPLRLELAAALSDVLDPDEMEKHFVAVRQAIYLDLGIPMPAIRFRFHDEVNGAQSHSPPASPRYRIMLFEVPIAEGRLRPDSVLVRENEHTLSSLGIPYDIEQGAIAGETAFWVAGNRVATLENAGLAFFRPLQILDWHLAVVLRKHAADFMGIQETRTLLSAMEAQFPELVKEAQRVMPVQKMAEIIQRLVSEEVSVRDMRAVLEALVEWAQKEKDSVLLTEYVRVSLKRQISYKYSNELGLLPAYLLAPDVEDSVRDAIRQTPAGSYLAMDPEKSQTLLENIKKVVGDISTTASRPVLLTSMDIRRYLRKLIEHDLYHLPVLSYQELTAEINVQPLARVDP
jgi:type III secretion protein V